MSNADEMLRSAHARAAELAAPGLDPRPRRKVAVLTCMDARIDVFAMLGLGRGDAHIVRNAGGLVTEDALRSLSISQRMLGTDEIVVVMHESCGLQGASEQAFAEQMAAEDASPDWEIGAFDDIDRALSEGLRRLRECPQLRTRESIRGFVFDPETGVLREVQAQAG